MPGGDGRAANFHQKVHKKVFGPSTKLRNSSTVRVDRRHNGIFLRVKRRKSQGGSGGMNYRGTYNTIL
ncbi:MAG TPA: hypothetical protein VFW23_02970, partial [Tepidisphaeraceae bacterium]|nr:hypothetical protein [Tepidisphaeraceae bacterium]